MKLSFSGICGSKPKLNKNEKSNVQQNARPVQQDGPFKADQFGPEQLEMQRARQEAADDRDFAILTKQIDKYKKRKNAR